MEHKQEKNKRHQFYGDICNTFTIKRTTRNTKIISINTHVLQKIAEQKRQMSNSLQSLYYVLYVLGIKIKI